MEIVKQDNSNDNISNLNCSDNDKIFVGDIENLTLTNNAYRRVLFTTVTQQLVLMSLLPKEEIGTERHINTTQFVRIESGQGIAVLNGIKYELKDNDAIVIPPGTQHNIINISDDKPLKLYTIYSPPEHNIKTVQQTKSDPSPLKGGQASKKISRYEVYHTIKRDYMSL